MTAASGVALGRLEAVDPREAWPKEDGDFTPWLAKDDNIRLLGEAIGADLEVVGSERDVGQFRADILCRNTDTDRRVLIENQLERTDHTHLGQLMTYAAGLDAVTVVWVARRFTEEHRAALDWLNKITGDEIGFFGIEIELWRIGNSDPAPKFNIVSKPNDWTKPSGGPSGRFQTNWQKFRIAYWQALWNAFGETMEQHGHRQPSSYYFPSSRVGRAGFRLYPLISTLDQSIAVQLEIGTHDAKADYATLYNDREAVEREVGDRLLWEECPGMKSSRITLRQPDRDPEDRELWQEQHAWFAEKLKLFHDVFAERIKAL